MHPPMPSTAPALPPAQPPIKSGTTSKVALSSPPLSKLPSRSSLTRTLAKGKGKMPDATSHSSSCTKCRLAMDASMAILDGSPPPTMSPDCVLFQNSGQMISADKKCFCSKDESPKRTAAYSTLHRLFYNRYVAALWEEVIRVHLRSLSSNPHPDFACTIFPSSSMKRLAN